MWYFIYNVVLVLASPAIVGLLLVKKRSQLARATGLPIVPLTFSCTKKNSLAVGIAS